MCFLSDLSRTAETMKLIQGKITALPAPVCTPNLREIDFGDLTGCLKHDIMPNILKHKEAHELPYPNGESGGQFIARVKGFFSTLMDRLAGGLNPCGYPFRRYGNRCPAVHRTAIL